jgi:hypothetical protein
LFLLRTTVYCVKKHFFTPTGGSFSWFGNSSSIFSLFFQIVWVDPNPVAYDWSSLPKRSLVDEDHTERYIYIAFRLAYGLGSFGLLSKFGVDFYSLRKIVKGQNVANHDISGDSHELPFFFFQTIVYNSNLYTTIELQNIIEHEKFIVNNTILQMF